MRGRRAWKDLARLGGKGVEYRHVETEEMVQNINFRS